MAFPAFEVTELIQWAGYLGLFIIVFAESGIFVGFFLPGDSLLFAAGLLASKGVLNPWILIPLLSLAAILGDSAGYWSGKKFGKKLFQRPDSRLFRKERLLQAQQFYQRHGGKTIVLARFMPFIRTFAPIVAGVADMPYRRFLFFNIFGGIFWVTSLTLAGSYLGGLIPDIDLYILPIIGVIVLISFIPAGIHYLISRRRRSVPPATSKTQSATIAQF